MPRPNYLQDFCNASGLTNVLEAIRLKPDDIAAGEVRVMGQRNGTDCHYPTIDGSGKALLKMVRLRDPYTAKHQCRVADLAFALACEMGLTESCQRGVRVAALLHDVGKIGIPNEILNKPGRLTRPEMDVIRTHPRLGAEILSSIDFPWPVLTAVVQHHERLDGTGYPYSLSGDAIILESRIVAVADVVEAISSHRPYRSALGLERALIEISESRGVKYDTQVVDACIRLCRHADALEPLLETLALDQLYAGGPLPMAAGLAY